MQSTTPRFDVRDYFRIAQKRKWFIILVGLTAMLIGGLYAVSYPKTYRATSLILVRQKPAGVVWLTQPTGRMGEGEITIETQAAIITSGEVADRVSQALREKRSGERVLAEPAEVQESLIAVPMPPDRIRVDAQSPIERNSIAFANEAAEQFLIVNTDFRREQDRRAREYLEEQLARTERELEQVRRETTDYQNRTGVYSEDAGVAELVKAMTDFRNARENAAAELAATRAQAQRVAGMLRRDEEGRGDTQSVPNPTLGVLRNQLVSAQVALAELSTRYHDAHPAVRELRARVASLQEQINATPATVDVPYGSVGAEALILARQKDALEVREADLVARVEAIDTILARLEQDAKELPAKRAELDKLQARALLLRETHARLLQELEAKRLEEAAKGGTAMILDSAARAISASPSVSRGLLFAGVLGLVAGLALALVLEALDDTIHTPDDIQRDTDVAFLGMVPLLDTALDELITISAPKSPPAESYRTLRSNINFSLIDEPARRFLITSAGSGEGKTVTAANMAVAYAQGNQRVVIVDTDLRRPTLHRVLHCDASRGLTNVLVGEASLEEVLQDTHVEGLKLLATGPLPPNPAEMLDSEAFRRLLDDILNHCDIAIFDSPPAIVLTDAVVLSSKMERTIIVAEAGQVTREALNEAVRLIRNARGNILGIVLNKMRLSASDYYYYYYYYDYSRETPRVITPPPGRDEAPPT